MNPINPIYPIYKGSTRKLSVYKSTIGNIPYTLRIPYIPGSGIESNTLSVRRSLNTRSTIPPPPVYIPPVLVYEEAGAAWPQFGGFHGANQFTTSLAAPEPWVTTSILQTRNTLIPSSIPVIAASGRIYGVFVKYLQAGGQVISFTPQGTVQWVYEFDDGVQNRTPLIGTDETLYITTLKSILVLTVDGNLKWKYTDNNISFVTSSVFVAAGLLVVETNRMFLLSGSGLLQWVATFDDYVNITQVPAVDLSQNIYICYGTDTFSINKYSPEGTLTWKTMSDYSFQTGSLTLTADESLVFSINTVSGQSYIMGYSTDTGEPVWAIGDGPFLPNTTISQTASIFSGMYNSLAIDSSNNIYYPYWSTVSNEYGVAMYNLNAFDPDTNNEPVWNTYFSNSISSTPMLQIMVDGQRRVLLSTTNYTNSQVRLLDDTGDLIWNVTFSGNNKYILNPPVVGENETIYGFGISNSFQYTFLYSIETGEQEPPSAPSTVSATVSGNTATVVWSASAGSLITEYIVNDGTTDHSVSSGLIYTQSGLTYGTTYTFTVKAVNSEGASAATSSNAVTPLTVPGVPQSVEASVYDATATVTWSLPASNGGSVITGYIVNDGTTDYNISGINTTIYTQSGLTYGTSYTFTIKAVNTVGASSPASSNTVVPITIPSAPQSVSATVSGDTATVTWSAPASNGGTVITGYVVNDGTTNYNVSAATFTYSQSGLTYGTTYTFTVKAVNAAGTSLAASSNSVTPITTPSAPQSVSASLSGTTATVTWSTPASNGGTAITGYVVNDGTTNYNVSAATFTYSQSGLTYGTTYTFTVKAVNAAGSSSTASSNTVTPMTTPSAPQSVSASLSGNTATITWNAPTSNGGSAITGYQISDGTNNYNVDENTYTYTKTELSYGVSYTFTVAAINSVGSSPTASASPVVPVTVPNAPQSVSTSIAATTATVTWSAPSSNGGSAITMYIVNDGIAEYNVSPNVYTYTQSGLTPGSTYIFGVRAVNAVGSSTQATSNSVTAYTTPGVPTSVSVSLSGTTATISWSAPSSDGGSAITGYIVNDGTNNYTVSASTFSYVKSSLTIGTTYNFTVRATNAAGNGSASSPVSVTPLAESPPAAPTITSAVISGSNLVVSFTQPTGSYTITNYIYNINGGSNTYYGSAPSTTLTIAFTASQNTNTIYIRAVNGSSTTSDPSNTATFYVIEPLVYYTFKQGSISGSNVYDAKNAANTATTTNGPAIVATAGPTGTNGFVRFTAASQQTVNLPATINSASLVQSTGVSASFWFKTSYASEYIPVFQLFSSASDNSLQFSPQNGIVVAAFSSLLYYNIQAVNNQNNNTWKHIVITYSPSKIVKIYINGSLAATSGTLANYLDTSKSYTYNSLGGNRYTNEYVTADVCLVAVFNSVLTDAQAALLYNTPTFLGY